jgi:putative integral membrane protein (TIGR02587 family)
MSENRDSPWRAEIDDLLRGVAGAFLFGSPFLYTMEVWWKGNIASPLRMVFALAITYLTVLVIDRALGFRRKKASNWPRAFADSAEALALGIVISAASLALLGIIGPGDGKEAVMGRIVMEAIPFSIGVGLANSFMTKSDENSDKESHTNSAGHSEWLDDNWRGTLADLGATSLGAIIIASSIAPTDEVQVISSGLSHLKLMLLVAASMLISYVIVFEANFGSQEARRSQSGIFQTPTSETVISYLASLVVSLSMLWLFQLVSTEDPVDKWIRYTLVLGFPATIGGAAGRLVI